ncbi:D-alanyl-D-alanine carboxypeptidase/D-alanyl-D-alanine endopeptidase [Paracoccus laeviglucosivorans]|uniref:D-alanyl-D-alanine carboxypeptidase / D-alanyl-D-alanine-endopeptidase (Penicillin-binding protein 4) n=1 Tax=Paracoccus laeviglucosivorans TaxID=1197861 RepID=A0A521BVC6_9RHOB|nr:D-alanyl-D-alanine carboxypeptidase/D-alanyl-D-alanine-endopeptidase [Paracoccus laeviglucosivorans]SMO51119.1 D-alanyl-D-alanine carboxypeptidase / D-alanyl-D-alanine-endopeptidase (penicillin-binding protein 4) [Paracoccus laeviglucosivorans]
MLTRRGVLFGLGAMALAPRGWAQSAPVFDPEAAIAAAKLGGDVGFAVIDAASGQMLASRHADRMMAPASTLKVATALYTLERLGPQHRFTTRVWRDGDTLILAGGGDPVLDTDALSRLAESTAAAWQGTPPTRFLIWGGALPRIARLSEAQDEYLPYNPTVSGMILNFNRVHLSWRAGNLSLEARGERQSPRAYTVAIGAADRSRPLFTYDGTGKLESWTIARGAMGKSGSRWLPVRRPELYAGDVFQTLCRARGLVLPKPEVAEAPPSGREIANLQSPLLPEIVTGMLEYSTNLTAEVLGLTASGAPDLAGSARAMSAWMAGFAPQQGFAFHDHSGLSPDNRMSAETLARLVAVQGRTRGLRPLLKHIPLRDAGGKKMDSPIRVDAKTGTLNFVSNLAGYAETTGGRELAFAILTGDEPRRAASEGKELPDGVIGWTKRSKALQQVLIEGWVAGAGQAQAGITPDAVLR